MENTVVNPRASRNTISTSNLVKIGMLGAVSIVLMQFELVLPIFPNFLKMDISDLPALVGAVAMGPMAGVLIELIKNILHLFKTSTGGVGEIANFLVGIALVVPIGFCYKKNKSLSGFIIGTVLGTISMVIVACIFNYYILIPAFSKVFGAPVEAFVQMAQAVNSHVVDLKTLVFWAIAPFNVLKAIVVAIIGYPLCKLLAKVL